MKVLYPELIPYYLERLIPCIPITLKIVGWSLLFGLFLGILLALAGIRRIPVLNQLSKFYISFMRGTPINIQLYIAYFGIPAILSGFFRMISYDINNADPMLFVVVTYSLNNAGFMAILIKSAILGVEKGQTEAGYAIGLTRFQTFTNIVAPQAIRIAIPDFQNMLVNLVKNTSLAYILGIIDIMGKVSIINTRTYRSVEGYISSAIIYFVISMMIEMFFGLVTKKQKAWT